MASGVDILQERGNKKNEINKVLLNNFASFILKGSYDAVLKINILFIWCNRTC